MTFAQKDGHTYGLVVLGSDLDNIYREASEILDLSLIHILPLCVQSW